jgi:hypothetical protein
MDAMKQERDELWWTMVTTLAVLWLMMLHYIGR